MKRVLIIGLIGGFALWVYQVPLGGRLPSLGRIKSGPIMRISSNAFTNTGEIPARFTCSGENINPEIEFSGIPTDTGSLVLIMDDPDAPNGTFTHWVVFNIKPTVKSIPEAATTVPGVQAKNSAGTNTYVGPCPPSGVHRYYFKLYALDKVIPIDEVIDKSHLQKAMTGHILETAEFMGKFGKTK